jgi:hypothetical protein
MKDVGHGGIHPCYTAPHLKFVRLIRVKFARAERAFDGQ